MVFPRLATAVESSMCGCRNMVMQLVLTLIEDSFSSTKI